MVKRWNRVAVYARVSKEDDQSVDQQVETLLAWVKDQAEHVDVVTEEESSRKERPKLQALRAKLCAGEYDAIVVWKLDRISRGARELLQWREERDLVGYDLVSFSQALDLSKPEGRLMYTILAGFAEYERDVISQRTKLKLDYLRKLGVGKTKQYDEAAAREHWDKMSERELAKALGVSKTTARRVKERMVREAEPKLRPLRLTKEQERLKFLERRVAELEELVEERRG